MSILPEGLEIAEFQPFIEQTSNSFTYQEANASYTEVQEPGSRIVLFRDNANGKIVGVRIEQTESVTPFNS